MSVLEGFAQAVAATGDQDLITAASVWTALLRQTSQHRTPHLHVALDAMDLVYAGRTAEATELLQTDTGPMWPTCVEWLNESFCPLCASVQSALYVSGVAPAVEEVRQHIILLKNRDLAHAQAVQGNIYRHWQAAEADYTMVVDGPGYLAFTEQV